MKGTVWNFKNVKGYGFLRTEEEDGGELFLHPDDLVYGMKELTGLDIQFLLDGAKVEFGEVVKTAKGHQALSVSMLDPGPLQYTVREDVAKPTLVSGTVIFGITSEGGLKMFGVKVEPVFEADGLKIYRMGENLIESFSARIPRPTSEKAYLFVDGRITGRNLDGSLNRGLRQPQPDGVYLGLRPGDFLVGVERSGLVVVLGFGARGYHGGGENYLIIERRFSHQYKLSGVISREYLLKQTPSDSDNKRTNDVFVPAIIRGLMVLEEAARSASVTATPKTEIAPPTPNWIPK